jgi:hypothetical protein
MKLFIPWMNASFFIINNEILHRFWDSDPNLVWFKAHLKEIYLVKSKVKYLYLFQALRKLVTNL